MINNFTKTTNITANSVIDGVIAVSMRATVSNEKWSINKNIRNSELYLTNQKECDADYAEFEAMVLELAK